MYLHRGNNQLRKEDNKILPSSQQAYQALSDYQKTRKNSQQIMDEGSQKYNIGGLNTRLSSLRGLVGNLENSVEAVDPSVTGRTSGSLVTEAQRSALVNRERAPILGDLAKQQQGLGQAQQDWSTANQLAGDYSRNLTSEGESNYNRLTQGYQMSLAAEQAAEEKRRWEAQQAELARKDAEEQRRWEAQFAASREAARQAAAQGYQLQQQRYQGSADSAGSGSAGRRVSPADAQAFAQRLSEGADPAAAARNTKFIESLPTFKSLNWTPPGLAWQGAKKADQWIRGLFGR